jgi:hypothetical protein
MYLFKNFLFVNEFLLILFAVSGLLLLIGQLTKKDKLIKNAAIGLAILGPLSLLICWGILDEFRDNDTLFWSRLMAGDSSIPFSIGSLFLIIVSGAAVFSLTLISKSNDKKSSLYTAFIFFFAIWIVRFLHPTPHYVPMPGWMDKMVWFVIILGVIGVCTTLNKLNLELPSSLTRTFIVFTGIFAMVLPFALISFSHYKANTSIDLSAMSPENRIISLGCLACHTAKGTGHKYPGGELEFIQSKTKETITEFLKEPSKEKAISLKIRENPSGQMSGVHLSGAQAELIASSLYEYLGVLPSVTKVDEKVVKSIIEKNDCMSCHSLKGEGAMNGGMGGPFEKAAANLTKEKITAWLENPSSDNALKLGISKDPLGSMSDIKLTKEEIETMVNYIHSLK